MAWLAIDAGTSVIKSVVYADDGRELGVARAHTTVLHPQPGWAEQDMREVWAAVVLTVRQAVAASGDSKEPIRGMVSTAQGDGCWLVDACGQPTGNAILWNDGRAAGLVERWREEGLVEACFRRSGSVTYSGLPNAILGWLRRHEPRRVEGARWALTCNGWLTACMTGRFAAELSDSANPFGDLVVGEYSLRTLTDFGLAGQAHLLPPIVAGRDALWELAAGAAEDLGLPPGLPVVAAPYDIVTTAYGSGAARAGQACVILGTTICAEILRSSMVCGGPSMGTTLPLDDGLYLRAMPTLTGCEALGWAAETLGVEGILALDEMAAAAPGNASLFFLPYLSPAGERSPFLAPEASGSFHGFTLRTTREDIARSVYEGLSFVVKECLDAACEGAPLTEVRVSGGGARSDFWCQMIADVLDVPVIRPADQENGARGAYLFAMFVTGEIASIAEGADRYVATARTFAPDRAARCAYDEAFRTFQQLRNTSMEQWKRIGRAD